MHKSNHHLYDCGIDLLKGATKLEMGKRQHKCNVLKEIVQIRCYQCTMAQALKKIGIKDLAKIMTLAPIFSSQNYFR